MVTKRTNHIVESKLSHRKSTVVECVFCAMKITTRTTKMIAARWDTKNRSAELERVWVVSSSATSTSYPTASTAHLQSAETWRVGDPDISA